MKTILILAMAISCFAAEITWAKSYADALATAKKEQKNVIVMLTKENCQACEYMEERVFKDDEIIAIVNKNFIPVMIEVKKEHVPSALRYFGTPTFYFLTPTEKQVFRQDGAEKQEDFLEILKSQVKK